MKVVAIFLWKYSSSGTSVILSSVYDLSSFGFFQRGTAKEYIIFGSREVVNRTQPGNREIVKLKDGSYHCHVWTNPKSLLSCSVVTDGDYPPRVAFSIVSQSMEAFNQRHSDSFAKVMQDTELLVPQLNELLNRYQAPASADPVLKIENDLEDTKQILVKSIDQLLERGATLEALAEKSNDLSFQSKAFMKQSKKLNSCCVIL